MDAHGIARTVGSLGNPWLDPFTGDESVEHARTLNDELAFYEVQTHGRVCAMGVLPGTPLRLLFQSRTRLRGFRRSTALQPAEGSRAMSSMT